jgi:hypothetical protein
MDERTVASNMSVDGVVEWIISRSLYLFSPGVKARPGRDADHSPPSSAEVVNE